jgi:hypothetical protein
MIRNKKAFCRELAETHQLWVRELSERLSVVRSPDNSAWERAAAVRYLEEEFIPRFRRHSSAVNMAAEQLPSPEATRVWARGRACQAPPASADAAGASGRERSRLCAGDHEVAAGLPVLVRRNRRSYRDACRTMPSGPS